MCVNILCILCGYAYCIFTVCAVFMCMLSQRLYQATVIWCSQQLQLLTAFFPLLAGNFCSQAQNHTKDEQFSLKYSHNTTFWDYLIGWQNSRERLLKEWFDWEFVTQTGWMQSQCIIVVHINDVTSLHTCTHTHIYTVAQTHACTPHICCCLVEYFGFVRLSD